jgi:hypothetical protein
LSAEILFDEIYMDFRISALLLVKRVGLERTLHLSGRTSESVLWRILACVSAHLSHRCLQQDRPIMKRGQSIVITL